jgi:hypothetical protein
MFNRTETYDFIKLALTQVENQTPKIDKEKFSILWDRLTLNETNEIDQN